MEVREGVRFPGAGVAGMCEVQVTLVVHGQLLGTTKRREEGKGRQRWCREDKGGAVKTTVLV